MGVVLSLLLGEAGCGHGRVGERHIQSGFSFRATKTIPHYVNIVAKRRCATLVQVGVWKA